MKYDFDKETDRRNTHSLKWDVGEGELPMWVADMDFETAPEIQAAIKRRAEHGIYGYTTVSDEWRRAYTDWWKQRHGAQIEEDSLIFCTGVVPAISSIVRKLTTPAEKVVFMTPAYNIFFNSVLNNGRQVLECPLDYDGAGYEIHFGRLEEALADPQTAMMILCNPHNPTGNIWGKEALRRIGELCAKYHVVVVSDEIHCDLTEPGSEYIPFASVSEACRFNSITCLAPTKAFNLAGIQTAAVSVPDETLRHKVWRGLNTDEVAEPNVFAVEAVIAAFTCGAPWLDSLRVYISRNRKFAGDFLKNELPDIHLVPAQATYLLWLDCSRITEDTSDLCAFIRRETGLYVSEGAQFGGNGSRFIRVNIACPKRTVRQGMERLKEGIEKYKRL